MSDVPVDASCSISCARTSLTAASAAASAAVCAWVEKTAARPTWKNSMPKATRVNITITRAGMIWPSWRRKITRRM